MIQKDKSEGAAVRQMLMEKMGFLQFWKWAPLWKGLHGISKLSPQHTHSYLRLGECVVSLGNEGKEETKYMA